MSYYDRSQITHLDGTPIFQTAEDQASEAYVAEVLASKWRCQIQSFGALSPVDWFAARDGRLVGVLELKSRGHPAAKYPTVFLNVRKWLALSLASIGLGCPAIFVVRFSDSIRWIPLIDIDAGAQRIGGCSRLVKSGNDIEPVIDVPILGMRKL